LRRPALEDVIGYILIIGVVTSLIMESAGLVLYTVDKGTVGIDLSDSEARVRSRDFFAYIIDVVASVLSNPSYASVMALGLVLLMLTPYLRVVASVVYFALSHNYKYVVITLIVLAMLTASLIAH
jgi:uncharacterized membrane protein